MTEASFATMLAASEVSGRSQSVFHDGKIPNSQSMEWLRAHSVLILLAHSLIIEDELVEQSTTELGPPSIGLDHTFKP